MKRGPLSLENDFVWITTDFPLKSLFYKKIRVQFHIEQHRFFVGRNYKQLRPKLHQWHWKSLLVSAVVINVNIVKTNRRVSLRLNQ